METKPQSNTIVRPVETKRDKKLFIKSQWNFYKDDPYFIPPVKSDRSKILDTNKNPFYEHSEIKLFLAERNNQTVGRVAAIVNENHNKTHSDKVGFFGFFECENNQETANLLFCEAEKWLSSKGIDTAIGPENPSMNDEIGLLVDGFNSSPLILMTYNPRYYIDLIEGRQVTRKLKIYMPIKLHQNIQPRS